MQRIHIGVDTITAFLATMVAGLSLALPIDFRWTSESTPLQLHLLAYSQPRAVAAGAIVAVVVATVVAAADSELVAWCTALCGVAVMTLNHVFGHSAAPSASLTTMNFVDATAGGVLLGAVGAAVARHLIPTSGWILGTVASICIAEALPVPHWSDTSAQHFQSNWTASDSPPTWLIGAALVLVAVSTYLNRRRSPTVRMSVELPMMPIVAVLVLVSAWLVIAGWLTRSGDRIVVVVVAVAIAALITGVIALLLPGRDGIFVLMCVGVAATGNATVSADLPMWAVPLFVVGAALGLLAGIRWPTPALSIASLLTLAVAAALLGHVHGHSVIEAIADLVLAVVTGYCLGSALPRRAAARVLGVVLLLAPSAVLALRTRMSYGDCTPEVGAGGAVLCEFDDRDTASPGWAAVATIVCCAIFVHLLRHREPESPSETP
ncbi:hypothetical protein [Nocardia wallacei]|uniref:hypothetical protein n=1 Tax=Nocardia wallacei TaxID=480035 RepID=UPI002453F375|nr:hypothetical protein [Nocardia wallacei]